MKSLVVYDSLYGNTQKIAQSIAKVISAKCLNTKEVVLSELKDINLLIIGSPTHGGQPTPKLQEFIKSIPDNSLKNIKALTFDTGIPHEDKNFIFKNFIKMLGYAAKRTAKLLEDKGANIISSNTFFVLGKEGPIKDGELERAQKWVKGLIKK